MRRLAWLLAAVAGVCAVAQTVVLASSRPLLSLGVVLEGWPLVTLGSVVGAVLGALVVSRHPRHPVGWLLCVGELATVVGLAAAAYGSRAAALEPARALDVGSSASWLGVLLGGNTVLALLAALFLLAPEGRLLSRRWRPALLCCLVGLGLHLAAVASIDPVQLDASARPVGAGATTRALIALGPLFLTAAMLAGAASVVVRLRRAEGDRRRQLLWLALPAATMAAGLLLLVLTVLSLQLSDHPEPGQLVQVLVSLPLFVAWAGLPLCAGIAVLRYRLYAIDVVVNRGVLLTVATGFVAIAYVGAVVTLGGALAGAPDDVEISLAGTTLAALAFQPVRRRAVRLADRLTYGPRAVPYEALADFSARLTASPSPEQLLAATAAAAGSAVAAQRVDVALHLDAAPDLQATWSCGADRPSPRGPSTVLVLREGPEVLGRMTVQVPAGQVLRPVDRQLLEDLADQTGLALRNARLEASLQAHVAELDRHTAELSESRRRLVDARDAEREALERSISAQVLPHLETVPGELERAAAALCEQGALPDLEPLVARTTAALESLRTLSHGVFPAQLSRSGLGPALRALLSRTAPQAALRLEPGVERRRFPPEVEAAVYSCCTEAVRAAAPPPALHLAEQDGELDLSLHPAPPEEARRRMRDRVEAVGGRLVLDGALARVCVPLPG